MGQTKIRQTTHPFTPTTYSLSIGHCKFNDNFTRDIFEMHKQKNLIYCDRKYLIQCGLGCGNRTYGHRKDENWVRLFPCIVQCGFQQIQFRHQSNSSILIQIVHIQWSNLTAIVLNDNKIANIEPLTLLDIPLCQKIDLEKNFITVFKPISKLNCNNLKQLFLSRNYLQSYGSVVRIETVHVCRSYGCHDCPQQTLQQTLSILAKMKTSKITPINFPQNARIKQVKVIQTLTKKYANIQGAALKRNWSIRTND